MGVKIGKHANGSPRYECRESRRRWHSTPSARVRKATWQKENRALNGRRDKPYLVHRAETCERCGFVPQIAAQLDVHHRDGDHENNAVANLETLCANCHRLVHWGGESDAERKSAPARE